ncbi:MAG: bifunctional diaminohydroxyphosphoribosylaminopyrimidine deaminase/5-amino-6-(5-phosphoribosylamino)uracil reductase RibD [Deltaproteobacteria bacterium]|jgi:diaminohydroxyphosphoribosylaminopyrimidine deaminase/5-amino-6-(5-phosphoribosylamino)uracil reductase|nr:bifunctional diaminohydroxyphosphoribosylaminopyrimidine deaminase/5-amino-6-(5-phosphoribosylamino)uracil reductase RibD [Deltaproteobacteria bacterium]
MQMALELAARALGRTTPNPPVGAVVVSNGRVVGEGFHPAAGQPHAEILALRSAENYTRGSELYVTLEPCCHHGRTGPCTEAIIAAGIHRVIVGCLDPNPKVSGQGLKRLRDSGIRVTYGILEPDCQRLISPFAKHVTAGMPYVVYKAAMSLDGQTATSNGESQWISSSESRHHVHRLRDQVDAILVGSATVIADNPRLTTRLFSGGRNPLRIVVDSQLITPPSAAVYDDRVAPGSVIVTSNHHPASRLEPYRKPSLEIIQVDEIDGRLNLLSAMKAIAAKNIQFILLEGGSSLAGAMLRAGLIDRIMFYLAPIMFGGNNGRMVFDGPGIECLRDAYRLTDLRVSRIEEDFLVEGEVARCSQD